MRLAWEVSALIAHLQPKRRVVFQWSYLQRAQHPSSKPVIAPLHVVHETRNRSICSVPLPDGWQLTAKRRVSTVAGYPQEVEPGKVEYGHPFFTKNRRKLSNTIEARCACRVDRDVLFGHSKTHRVLERIFIGLSLLTNRGACHPCSNKVSWGGGSI